MRSIGMPELCVILFVAVLLFGGKKVPELAKALGSSLSEFKKAVKEGDEAKREVEKL